MEEKGIRELKAEISRLSSLVESARLGDKSVTGEISAQEVAELKKKFRSPEALRIAMANRLVGELVAEISPTIDITSVAKGFSAWGKYSSAFSPIVARSSVK